MQIIIHVNDNRIINELSNSQAAVKEFWGNHYEHSYVPQKAKDILLRHDKFSQHYEIIDEFNY